MNNVFRNNNTFTFSIGLAMAFAMFLISFGTVSANNEEFCINPNTASFDELKEIIHIDEERAGQIEELRNSGFVFEEIEDLTEVNGIGNVNILDIVKQNEKCLNEIKEEVVEGEEANSEDELIVPETSTNMYNFMLFGAILTILGLVGFLLFNRQTSKE